MAGHGSQPRAYHRARKLTALDACCLSLGARGQSVRPACRTAVSGALGPVAARRQRGERHQRTCGTCRRPSCTPTDVRGAACPQARKTRTALEPLRSLSRLADTRWVLAHPPRSRGPAPGTGAVCPARARPLGAVTGAASEGSREDGQPCTAALPAFQGVPGGEVEETSGASGGASTPCWAVRSNAGLLLIRAVQFGPRADKRLTPASSVDSRHPHGNGAREPARTGNSAEKSISPPLRASDRFSPPPPAA
ncbi:hypothetical protein SAMN00790413_03118 [Deinococcus hopiensis KR-140]|uniref:Uncharacterized protein n=1 Tax=Deinococcus hopiensis KR-140 TaxID=695939 RepID=A0A1W1VT12_9DEIO|nr:hypothetical protein SAMN00790413_03118 [Deinococcus hopiensis KR-140]